MTAANYQRLPLYPEDVAGGIGACELKSVGLAIMDFLPCDTVFSIPEYLGPVCSVP